MPNFSSYKYIQFYQNKQQTKKSQYKIMYVNYDNEANTIIFNFDTIWILFIWLIIIRLRLFNIKQYSKINCK